MSVNLIILQMLEDKKGLLQAAEEKRQASIAELSAKHQKVNLHADKMIPLLIAATKLSLRFNPLSYLLQVVESMEAQLVDAVSDRTKATETISSLQVSKH